VNSDQGHRPPVSCCVAGSSSSRAKQAIPFRSAERGRPLLNKATPGQLLAAAEVELARILKRLIVCRNRQYRESGNYPDDLGAAIQRTEFLLRDILAGLVNPVQSETDAAKEEPAKINRAWTQ
jgi:hypothetical protein